MKTSQELTLRILLTKAYVKNTQSTNHSVLLIVVSSEWPVPQEYERN